MDARPARSIIRFDGHDLAFRVVGEGPALVVLNLYRRPETPQSRLLTDRWQVIELCPLGYGYSDRVPGYAGERLVEQVHAVLDHRGVDRFVVWGFSAGAAKAACVARASPRAAGVVCGAFDLVTQPTPGSMRRMDRRLAPDQPARSLWWWYTRFDWADELARMPCTRLVYWGSEDRHQAKGLRRARQMLALGDVDFVEYPGVGQEVGGDPALVERFVVPTFVEWAAARLPSGW